LQWDELIAYFTQRGRPHLNIETEMDKREYSDRIAEEDKEEDFSSDAQKIQDEDEFEEEIERYDYQHQTKGSYQRGRASYRMIKDPKYTIPEPFNLQRNDNNRSKSIRARKVEEMILEKESEEAEILNFRFRAKSVPAIVAMPMFDQIIQEQEQRRAQVKKELVAITKLNEAPFSFYLRDQNKTPPKVANPEFNYKFKAKPIPGLCQVPELWDMMNRRSEIERKERVTRRAQENLVKAALPPRMEKHEKQKVVQKLMNNQQGEAVKEKKFVAKEVPDFEKMHKQFNELLERKKNNKRPTEISEFNFQEVNYHPQKGAARDYLNQNQAELKEDPIEIAKRVTSAKPKIQPQTTKKMIALSEQRKKEREENQRKIEQIEKEDEERNNRYQKMKAKVQDSSVIQESIREQDERKQRMKRDILNRINQDEQKYKERKKEIEENVSKRPLLVEQENESNIKKELQAMEDLKKLNKIMKAAGVKDPSVYFTREERDKISDAEYLEKRKFNKAI